MHKSIAALAVAAAVAGGGAAGALLGMPGLSVAQSSDSSTTTAEPPAQAPAQVPDQAPATPAPAEPAPGGVKGGGKQGALDRALQGLVDNGTLTQQQADAVRKALADEMAKLHGGHGPRMGHGPFAGHPLEAAAKALGMSEADLRAALRGGKTIAAVAQDKGVALDTVVDALVADASSRIDQAVTAGRLTQQQADSLKSTLKDRVTRLVQNPPPMPRRPHDRGDGPPPAPGASGSGSATTPGGVTPQSYTTS